MSPFKEYYSIFQGVDDRYIIDPLSPRSEVISRIGNTKRFDIIIVGGGIHGAVLARMAAFNGISTLLLERDDYAQATSSRSSKMAHGGLRYLEFMDLRQVFEGLSAREDLFITAPHLVTPTKFLFAIKKGEIGKRLKVTLGLTLYDILAGFRRGFHKWRSMNQIEKSWPSIRSALGDEYLGAFEYVDGLMNDSRLVMENILAARQEGAFCLNYANVEAVIRPGTDSSVVWEDKLTGERHRSSCGLVINCAGPWVPFAGRVGRSDLRALVTYSQGSHLVFAKRWEGPPVVFPLEGKGRYYFVWPHGDSTLVGTTERHLDAPPHDPIPQEDEIQEILGRVAKDLPRSGLSRENLSYLYAGVRPLPVRANKPDISQVSRRHIWHYANGMLSLIGGKFTTASWTAYEGLKKAYELSGIKGKPGPLKGRVLPGAFKLKEVSKRFLEGVEDSIGKKALSRFGSRVRHFADAPDGLSLIANRIFKGEIDLALNVEQAISVEDVIARRLCLEHQDDHGLSLVPYLIERGCKGATEYEDKVMKCVTCEHNLYNEKYTDSSKA